MLCNPLHRGARRETSPPPYKNPSAQSESFALLKFFCSCSLANRSFLSRKEAVGDPLVSPSPVGDAPRRAAPVIVNCRRFSAPLLRPLRSRVRRTSLQFSEGMHTAAKSAPARTAMPSSTPSESETHTPSVPPEIRESSPISSSDEKPLLYFAISFAPSDTFPGFFSP